MAKIRLLLIAFLSITLSVHSQQKITKFERELNEFRYSLYEILDTIPFEQFGYMNSFISKDLQNKIETFIVRHKKDIHQYKVNIFNQYKNIPLPDLTGYSLMDTEGINTVSSAIKDQLRSIRYIYDLYTINPVTSIYMYTTTFSGYYGSENLAAESIKSQMAAYRISTRKKDKDTWLISADRYKYIFEFTYSFKDNFLYFDKVYEKQKSTEPDE